MLGALRTKDFDVLAGYPTKCKRNFGQNIMEYDLFNKLAIYVLHDFLLKIYGNFPYYRDMIIFRTTMKKRNIITY